MLNHHFLIRVVTHYVDEQSNPDKNQFVFSYTVTIENNGKEDAQLLRRKWLITDSNGKKLVIEGDGVVGEQPFILANGEYIYTSGTLIETPVGVMQGIYTMQDEQENKFEVEVAPFRFALPHILH